MLVDRPKITRNVDEFYLSFPLAGTDKVREAQKLVAEWRTKKAPLDLSLRQARKKRSLDANAYMWLLCQAIAETLGTTKEEVYRNHIRDYGLFYTAVCRTDEVPGVVKSWNHNGMGWVADYSNNYDGTATVLLYPGSSTYDTRQMSRLIDSLAQECSDLGLTVQIPPEVEALLRG